MKAEKCPHCGMELPLYLTRRTIERITQAAEVPAELVNLPLYAKDDKLRARWGELFVTWKTAYPGLDILTEVRRAHAWETACTTHRKVNRAKFLTNWLARAQDRASSRRAPEVQPDPENAPARRLEALKEAVTEWLDSPTWTGL